MKSRKEGNSQELSAAKAGISERSARAIDQGKRADPNLTDRQWRTRKDPFEAVWASELEPMLKQTPRLQPITLLEHLQATHPGEYPDNLLRTLQRRIKKWRALHGPDRDVIFRQEHAPGRQGLSDFTKLKDVVITIAGKPFKHLLYHFRLAFSHWSYMEVIEAGESYTALASGLQEALQRLGGAPREHRTDSLSAAFKNLRKDDVEDITNRYSAFCQHYMMTSTRNNRGVSHENGSVESPHGHLKRRIVQALLLRGSCDFESIEAYKIFIEGVVLQNNRRNAKTINLEREALQPLPKHRGVDYTEVVASVSTSSTINVKRVTYTVPSRLEGETLHVRVYDSQIACYLGRQHVVTLKRVYPNSNTKRARQIDYKHVIHSLVKKPQVFRYSQIRDDLLPTPSYEAIWAHLDTTLQPRQACKFIVGLLHLAATEDCEKELAQTVLDMIDKGKSLCSLSYLVYPY